MYVLPGKVTVENSIEYTIVMLVLECCVMGMSVLYIGVWFDLIFYYMLCPFQFYQKSVKCFNVDRQGNIVEKQREGERKKDQRNKNVFGSDLIIN